MYGEVHAGLEPGQRNLHPEDTAGDGQQFILLELVIYSWHQNGGRAVAMHGTVYK